MSVFSEKVMGVDCLIELNEDYKIMRITTKEGCLMSLEAEEIERLEEEFDHLIAAVKREDEQDGNDYEAHIRRESAYVRQL